MSKKNIERTGSELRAENRKQLSLPDENVSL